MVKLYSEKVDSKFEGTIIDLETIGEFDRRYYDSDSRRYKNLTPTILGFINQSRIEIYCAKCHDSLDKINSLIVEKLGSLEKPFHAFNSDFERGVVFHRTGLKINFEKELSSEKFEPKGYARRSLGIPNYDDPFNDDGSMCAKLWPKEIDKCMAHNRACLLKERDILLKRGFREPDGLVFFEI